MGIWSRNPRSAHGSYDHWMERVNKFVEMPSSSLIVGTVTSTLVGIAVFFLGAPPVILLPAILIVGTAYMVLHDRALDGSNRR